MDKIEEVSIAIRKRREELGLYQEDVVEKLRKENIHISVSGLSRIESSERQKLDSKLLIALSKILKKDFMAILGHNPQNFNGQSEVREESNVYGGSFQSFVTIPLYSMASAGNGLIEFSNEVDYIDIPKLNGNVKKSDFASKVKGDSMEPYYHEGDIIVVDVSNRDIRTLNGKEALIDYDGKRYLKIVEFEVGTGDLRLKSYNPAYSDIQIKNYDLDEVECKGVISMVISMRNNKRI
ncbi:XRE family transcriptional regulator [Pseudoleptotrichia goodfellowii]|uniref:Peptidase S24-like protein n=1 Tax=Pseudoleptotrichia goodfellowii TaxID=157692 RepID=A0A510JAJ2_9FUSO|nr:LexA family transcriptional regulator [Pseudoleptotrichia goodfellowii]BBM35411.1 peptidase S24-like protein [Pseudoleptotrichia goodfellowii]